MKKIAVPVIVVFLLLMLLISCTKFVPLTPEQIKERITRAETAMSEGDNAAAESLFKEVLRSDPDNGIANMGTGYIQLLKSQRSMMDFVADYLTVQELQQLRSFHQQPVKSLANRLMMARSLVNRSRSIDFESIQLRVADMVDQIEDAKSSLKKAVNTMSEDASMTVYPNAFDWNEDGDVDSELPLNFAFDVDGESRVWWLIFYNEPEVLSSATQRGFFDATIKGDAWFDMETIEFLFEDGMVPEGYEPTFNEDDHITLDATGAKLLLTFVNLELSLLEPLIIWDVDPNPELTDFLEDFRNADNPINFATSTLDADANGTITNTEFRTVLPEDFLAFYDNKNGGADAISDWKEAIVDFCNLAIEVIEMDLFDIALPPISDQLDYLKNLLTDPAEKVELSEGIFFVPYNFFNAPNNFADLKDFIPDVGYDPFLTPSFPDPTFGGLIEGLE